MSRPLISYRCSECERVAPDDQWEAAWSTELDRRKTDPSWNDDDYGPNHGLDERMVCPSCKYVHADDDCSSVEEVLDEGPQ